MGTGTKLSDSLTAAIKEGLVLPSLRSGVILGSFDILVDIGVPAEKEVIQ